MKEILLFDRLLDATTVLLLCWVRVRTVFQLLPFFGEGTLPLLARNGLTVSLSLFLYPMVAAEVAAAGPPQTFFWFLPYLFKEILLGVLFGFMVSLVFWTVSGIGFFIDNQRGASMASVINPLLGDQASPLGSYMMQVVVTLMFVTGGMTALIEGLYASYALWPVLSFYPNLNITGARFFLEQFDLMMYLIAFLGGPIILFMFLAEFGLALVGRFAPQLNVFFLAMPVKSGIAVLVMAFYLFALMAYFDDHLRAFEFIAPRLDRVLG